MAKTKTKTKTKSIPKVAKPALRTSQIDTLQTILDLEERGDPPTIPAIAAARAVASTTVRSAVLRMKERKLVSYSPVRNGKTGAPVTVTALGQRRLDAARAVD